VASVKQVLFGCEELVLGEGRVELASHLRSARDDEPYRAAPSLQPVYGLQDEPSELLGIGSHPPNTSSIDYTRSTPC
jgi:hypothetical protein